MPATEIPAPPDGVATVEGADPATDEPLNKDEDPDMGYKIACPICEDKFKQPQGLHGHLRFSHQLQGDELNEVYERAQNEDHFDFTEDEGEDESDEDGSGDLQDLPSVGDEKAVAEAFDWEARLDRMESLRKKLDRLDRSSGFWEKDESGEANSYMGLGSGVSSFFRKTRDEGAHEVRDALDDIEMEVRERLGASEEDRQLRKLVDDSLDAMEAMVRCREQREAIKEKFSGDEAQKRVQRLDEKEVEIRAEIRELWDAGKPTEALDPSDPVREIESN
ncbi:hypothetical protein [Salinibacter ruber]|uniref:hypothetical protein n=1 Tax=Salinibacter ruber TaxID=146919 RepID=UPI00216A3B1D|nr:hypothetical protein [Salinibacter ruber]MCS3824575.1 hypothetical protein [Salinibacter ruber]